MKPSDVGILIVDDEPLILEVVSDLFSAYQFRVDTASSGNQAWEMIQKNHYDLVLSDVRMPDGDGIDLVKRIKAKNASKPSVLFMSGFSDLMNEEIYHIGAEGKFVKPFDNNAVRQAIELCLLAREVKWAQPMPPNDKMLTIEKEGLSVQQLEEQKAVIFGRGGFFIAHNYAPPTKGSSIAFSIEIKQHQTGSIQFRGVGVIRWIQSHGKSNIPPGLGIEITNLPPAEAKIYHQLFGNLVPFIPSVVRSSNAA